MLSSADHTVSPPRIEIPRNYNAAHDLLERNLRAGRAEKVAYIDDTDAYSYGELSERVNQFANVLGFLGIPMEQRVLLCLFDTIDFPTAFLGCVKAGIVPVAVNTLLTAVDFEYILDDSRACAVVISEPLLAAFESVLKNARSLKHIIVSGAEH